MDRFNGWLQPTVQRLTNTPVGHKQQRKTACILVELPNVRITSPLTVTWLGATTIEGYNGQLQNNGYKEGQYNLALHRYNRQLR